MKNRTIIGIVCIILSVAIMFGIAPLAGKMASGKTSILRVVTDISQGKVISESDIAVVEVGKTGLQENALSDTKSAIGKFAACDIKAGTNILSSYLSDKADSAEDIFKSLDGTKQAISITIENFAGGVSGKLQNGDIVSVIVTREKSTTIPAELTYVKVITTTTATGTDKDELKADEDGNYELPTTVTLLVNKEQAKILANYESEGNMHLSLVFRGEVAVADKFIEQQEKIFSEKK
ncbi:MAG: Flp pilus assembly protein CpaB [Oscillospiraceae bacterium]